MRIAFYFEPCVPRSGKKAHKGRMENSRPDFHDMGPYKLSLPSVSWCLRDLDQDPLLLSEAWRTPGTHLTPGRLGSMTGQSGHLMS